MKHKILYCYPMRLLVLVSAAIALLVLLQTQLAWRAIAKFWSSSYIENNRS